MKLDLTKLPVGSMLVLFLVAVLAVTFVGAFSATQGGGGAAVSASPSASPAAGTPSPAGSPPPSGAPSGGAAVLDVSMGDNFFEYQGQRNPTFTITAGQQVTINLTNKGTAIHNLRLAGDDNQFNTSDDAASDPQLITAGGGTGTVKWAPKAPGTYNYQCDFHPADMKGTITVK